MRVIFMMLFVMVVYTIIGVFCASILVVFNELDLADSYDQIFITLAVIFWPAAGLFLFIMAMVTIVSNLIEAVKQRIER